MSSYMDYLASKKTCSKTYEEYLNSDHWKFFSNAMRKKHCWCCNSRGSLQVHHITYERLGEELPDDVITVCGRCHIEIHEVARNGVLLSESHKTVKEKYQPKIYGEDYKRRCTDWKDLCNIFLKERPKDVAKFLLLEKLVDSQMSPTSKAVKLRLYKKGVWNKTRYLSMTRNKRRGKPI